MPFTKDNPRPGPGRPVGSKNRYTDYRDIIDEALDEKTMRAVLKKIAQKAKGGDMVAAKLACEFKFGKPPQAVKIEGTMKHEAIPDQELHEVALRSAERILRRNGRLRDGAITDN